jgi:hypothetical protein
MPDHLHALLSFPRDEAMSRIIGEWKHFQAREHGIIWQSGHFDHRLRDDERGEQQLSSKINYIRQNPVAAGLCADAAEWRWWIERSALDDKSVPAKPGNNKHRATERAIHLRATCRAGEKTFARNNRAFVRSASNLASGIMRDHIEDWPFP